MTRSVAVLTPPPPTPPRVVSKTRLRHDGEGSARKAGRVQALGEVMSRQVDVVPGRNCDGCTMCCKLLSVAELDKEPVTWCRLCDAKAGCNAYAQRPTECRDFYCRYLLDPALDDRWKPSHCKLVITHEEQLGETL